MLRFLFIQMILLLSAGGLLLSAEVRVFSGRGMDDVPASGLQRALEQLPPAARSRALAQMAGLPIADAASLVVDESGSIAYVCGRPSSNIFVPVSPVAKGSTRAGPVNVSPFPVSLLRHSRPGSANRIYLDFDGGIVTGTRWNTGTATQGTLKPYVAPRQPSWNCTPFGRDADLATYSAAEQDAILEIWSRVAEDYAPFDVDVTTEAPASFTNTTAWVMITDEKDTAGNNTPNFSVGGIAWVNTFGFSGYSFESPAWVWAGDIDTPNSNIAEAASHEVGHNLGLSHDTTNADLARVVPVGYYSGHPTTAAAPSWGPIMGASYGRDLSQWSKGDYFDANNLQNDLSLIANKLTVKPDDHANVAVGATVLSLSSLSPSSNAFSGSGTIERTADVDAFAVTFTGGRFQVQATPFTAASGTAGGNLDILLTLTSADGSVIATADPVLGLGASLDVVVGSGTYTVLIGPAAKGSPFATTNRSGYTIYGVLGSYTLQGIVTSGAALVSAPVSPVSFGPILSGATTTRDIIFSNGGTAPLTLTSFSTTFDAPFTLLSLLPATPLTLNAGASFTCTVQFAPLNAGAFVGTLTAVSDSGGTVIVNLSGVVNSALVSSPLSPVAFGPVLVGQTITRDITLTNSGAIPLSLTSFGVNFDPAITLLTPAPTTPQTLNPGDSILCTVQFAPVAVGAFTGTLSAGSDVGGSVSVSISGVGTVPSPPAAAAAAAADDGGEGGGGGCGAGTGIAAILALLVMRLMSQRLARSVR